MVARIGLATGMYVKIRVAASIHGDCARDIPCSSDYKQLLSLALLSDTVSTAVT